jgi:hypothetical protein
MDILNWLTGKIEDLQNSWRVTSDVLNNSLELININTNIAKDWILIDNIDTLSSSDLDNTDSWEITSLKSMYDSLWISD